MLAVESIVLENPRLSSGARRDGTAYWSLEFDTRFRDAVGNVWLTLYGLRLADGKLWPARRKRGGLVLDAYCVNCELGNAVLEAARSIGWPERYVGVGWPPAIAPRG